MADGSTDLIEEYRAYLQRFDQLVGDVDFGTPAKYKGRLVTKLPYEQFETRWTEFTKFDQAYKDIMARGDTVNDSLQKLLRDRAAELLLENTGY